MLESKSEVLRTMAYDALDNDRDVWIGEDDQELIYAIEIDGVEFENDDYHDERDMFGHDAGEADSYYYG